MKRIKYLLILIPAITIFALSCFAKTPEITDTALRAEQNVGIRVIAEINAGFADENVGEYGFLVVRKVFLSGDGLENDDLTLDCGAYYTKGISRGYDNGKFVDRFIEKTDETISYAAYVYGIPTHFYSEILVARPYACKLDGSVVYGTPVEISLYGVAKEIKGNAALYESLTSEQKDVVDSIIVAVDGEPYVVNRDDLRIVLSSKTVKNPNPTYSVSYDLYNPFTGEVLRDVKGRKTSKNIDEISSMLLEAGKTVPMYNGIVQDTTEGYVHNDLLIGDLMWIIECDTENGTIVLVKANEALKCSDCIQEYIEDAQRITLTIGKDTPVSAFGGDFENADFSVFTAEDVENKNPELLCYYNNGTKKMYSEYVKTYVSFDENECEYLLAAVNGNENAAKHETCLNHTYFDVDFYVNGELYKICPTRYGYTPTLPYTPEKEGYDFLGWSCEQGGEVTSPESIRVTDNIAYYAVFEKKSFGVTFYVQGSAYAQNVVSYGDYLQKPDDPSVKNAIFVGWSLLENGTADDVTDVTSFAITEDTAFYAVLETLQNDPNLIEIMTRGLGQLKKIRITQGSKNDIARDLIVECMTYVLEDANAGIYIDKSYIYETYNELAKQIKKAIKDDMSETERSAFVNILTNTRNIDKDVQDFLIAYFDIDMNAI